MALSSLNPLGSKSELVDTPVEGEENVVVTSTEPSAPVVDATVISDEGQPSQKFEWNVERLFAHNPEHSAARTWIVRILGLVVGIPTLILDLGRRLAFSLGLVNGQSYSLIDIASNGCKAVSDKVSSAWKSCMTPKELTLEEQNEQSKRQIQEHAQRLVDGYKNLNGGYFHTNGSFSSPHALKAEQEIRKERGALVDEVNAFVARNAQSADDFSGQVEVAKGIVWEAINTAAGDEFYIANKVERIGEPDLVRDVAYQEFEDALKHSSRSVLAEQFVEVSSRGDNFAAGLRKGVETSILTADQAAGALEAQAQSVYAQGLETGVQEAERAVHNLLDQGVREKIVTRDEALEINERVQPDVETLAEAAARDIARNNTPEGEVTYQLIKTSKDLQKAKRLKDEDVSRFLTSAEAKIAQAKEAVAAEQSRVQEQTDKVEAQRVAAVQKAADQQSLFSQFEGMLELIAKKQSGLTSQFLQYDELEAARQEVTSQLETIRNTKVTIRGSEITVLQAADEYYSALSQISRSSVTPVERQAQMRALADQGFTQTTLDRIEELKGLEPRLSQLINSQAALAQEIETKHDELSRLRGVYRVFRKNNFAQLETENRRSVVAREAVVNRTQRTLNERHAQLVGRTGIIARLRLDEPSVPVNIDPTGNRSEVEALIEGFRNESRELVPHPRSNLRRLYDGMMAPIRWIKG